MIGKELTENEQKVLGYCLSEDSSKAIAEDLGIEPEESTQIIAAARKHLGLIAE